MVFGLRPEHLRNISQSVFAIVADGFDWTSFHGFLAKRLLLRGGRLLKYIGVAAVVAAREISGCGFPAQVAVNALVIAVKLTDTFSAYLFAMSAIDSLSFYADGIRLERFVTPWLSTCSPRMCATRSFTAPIRHLLGMLRHDRTQTSHDSTVLISRAK
jgi:hypothetical protein